MVDFVHPMTFLPYLASDDRSKLASRIVNIITHYSDNLYPEFRVFLKKLSKLHAVWHSDTQESTKMDAYKTTLHALFDMYYNMNAPTKEHTVVSELYFSLCHLGGVAAVEKMLECLNLVCHQSEASSFACYMDPLEFLTVLCKHTICALCEVTFVDKDTLAHLGPLFRRLLYVHLFNHNLAVRWIRSPVVWENIPLQIFKTLKHKDAVAVVAFYKHTHGKVTPEMVKFFNFYNLFVHNK